MSCKNYGYLTTYCNVCKKPQKTVLSKPIWRKTSSTKVRYAGLSKKSTKSSFDFKEVEVSSSSSKKSKRLSNDDVANFVAAKKVQTETSLMAIEKEDQSDGLPDICTFLLKKTSRTLNNFITTTWKIYKSQKGLKGVIFRNYQQPSKKRLLKERPK